ncbi:MAG TPA: MmgE/PrpD family protein [Candidatus Binatia bacterium]|jgi:aconitate decarboxylase|nr:MmgE/PrpD family protein [Candidatus Binatia bacterium]
MKVTESLCRTIVQTSFASLPSQVVEVAKRIILDGIAVAVAGSTEDGPRIVAEHVKSLGGTESSTVLGQRFKTSPVSAAYVNGIAMHVLDYEPMWSPPTHATSPTLPTILALAEVENVPGHEVIAAFVKACEMQGRLRLASQQYTPGKLIYHPPGVVGVMGSVVAASHLLGLSLPQLQNALGIAASRAGGLMANVGTMTKATHCGWAAAAGLDAALLARRGFTGNTEIFEAPNGYADAFFGEGFDFSALMAFGHPYRLVDPGFAIKLFPSQYATHFGITAALELHEVIDEPKAIKSVQITMPVMPYVDRPLPRTGLEGKFSFQYTVAAALLDGAVTVRTFSDERRFRQDLVALLPIIVLTQSAEIPGELEKMWVEVTVELHGGRQIIARCRGPKGFWGLPPLAREEHLVKIRDCLNMRLAQNQTERCIALVEDLDSLEPEGVRELVAIVGCEMSNE